MMRRLTHLLPLLALVVTLGASSAALAASSLDVTVATNVTNATAAPSLIAPGAGVTTTATPTLRATYTDPELDPGTITFEVCSTFDCSAVVQSGSSAGGLASGAEGSWTVSTPLAAGTYYWRANATDSFAYTSGWSAIRSFTTISTPDITSISPTSMPQSASGHAIQINGTGFMSGATVTVSGTDVSVDSVSFVSSTRLDVTLSATAVAPTGTRDITVMNTDTGATTETGALTVTSNAPTTTVAPAITGTTTFGQTLTATSGTWTGAPTYAYQWQRCTPGCTNISGATSTTYTLVAADINATIRVNVTASNGSGNTTSPSAQTATIAGVLPTNTTAPTFTGPGFVGERYTASPGTWSTPSTATYDYQWMRCDAAGTNCVNVGTNSNLYWLAPADTGSTIRVAVTATNTCTTGCGSATETSAASSIVMNHYSGTAGVISVKAVGTTMVVPVTTAIPVDGFAALPISFDTSTTVASVRDSQGNYWKMDRRASNGALLSTETWSTFITRALSPGDTVTITLAAATNVRVASLLRFQHVLWPALEAGSTGQGTSTTPAVGPHWAAVPTVSLASIGTNGVATDTYAPSSPKFIIPTIGTTGGGDNTALHMAYEATNGVGSLGVSGTLGTSRSWAETGVAYRIRYGGSTQPSMTTAPAITGTAIAGQTLTASDGAWSDFPSFTRFWSRCDAAGAACQPIPGAFATTYALTSADVDRTIRYTVIATNNGGSTSAVTTQTALVAGVAPVNSTAPSISGSANVGAVLTANPGTWSGTGPITYTYQWQQCSPGCTNIAGATSSTYTVAGGDMTTTLRAVVTATNTCTSGCGSSSVNTAETSTITLNEVGPPASAPTIVPNTNTSYQHVIAGGTPKVWINTAFGGSFFVRANATDAGAGVDRVEYPDPVLAGWTPTGIQSVTSAPLYQHEYTWTAGSSPLGVQTFVVWDKASTPNQSTGSFEVAEDTTPPTSGDVDPLPAYSNASSVTVGYTFGSDGESGVSVANSTLQRESATLAGDACTWNNDWAAVTLVGGADTSIQNARCYRYRVHTVDNVGNVTDSPESDIVRVDTAAPTGDIDAAPLSPWRGSVTVTGTSGDALTAVQGVALSYTGASTGVATGCAAMTSATWVAPGCSLNTVGMPSGSYVFTATITDRAGNTFAATRNVTIDNSPPSIAAPTFTELTGPEFQYLAPGGTFWVNPTGNGSTRVTTVATDNPSGMASVGFPSLGGTWLPTGGNGTPGAGDTYSYDYSFTAPVVMGAGPFQLTGTDNAGNPSSRSFAVALDGTQPTGGAISYPSAGAVPSITFTVGSDGQSGVRTWFLERRATPTATPTTCGAGWGGWGQAGLATPTSPMSDNTVAPSTCYQYRLVVIDNVENRREYPVATTFITPTPRVVVSPAAASTAVTERGAAATWTVVLTAAPTSQTTVALTGGAGRLALSASSVTFDALDWYLPKTITVTAVDDDVDTTPDSVTVQVAHRATSGDASYTSLSPVLQAVTVTDDDKAGISADQASLAVNEPATSAGFGVRLNTRPVGTITVTLGTGSSQANVAPTTMSFDASNWNVAQAATVTAADDPDVDGVQAASVTITGAASAAADAAYAGASAAPVAVSVADDDSAGLVVDAAAVTRVAERSAETDTSLTVRLAARPSRDVRVAPAVPDGELRAPTGAMTFTRENWNVAQTVRVVAFDDPVAEATPHVGRVVLRTTSEDAAFGAIAERPVAVEIADDDPARLVATPGSGWTLTSEDLLELREDATSGAVVTIAADGDPTRAIRIEPVVTSEADVKVTPAAAIIDPDAPNVGKAFTVTAVDDGVNEDATEAVRLTWKVTTIDPMYDGRGVSGTGLRVIDRPRAGDPAPPAGGGTGGDPAPNPEPGPPAGEGTPDPGTGSPNPEPGADPTPGGEDPGDPGTPGETVGDDGSTTSATGATPKPNRSSPSSHTSKSVSKKVKNFAKEHPVATSGIATGILAGGSALAKPLLVGGKLIGSLGGGVPGAGGGMGNFHGLGQLRRLIFRKKKKSLWKKLLKRRRRKGDDAIDLLLEDDDDLGGGPMSHLSRGWQDLLDPTRNRR